MRLKNQEFAVAYNELIDLLEGEEILVEYVTKAFDEVKTESAKLVLLRNMNRKHHLTKTIRVLTNERNDYFSALTTSVKAAMKLPSADKRAAAETLAVWLDAYKEPLSKARLVQQTSLTDQILDDIAQQERLNSAMTTLELLEILESIDRTNNRIKSHTQTRSKELAASRREANKMKRVAYDKLILLLNTVIMAIKLGDGDTNTYLRYVKEINEVLEFYQAIVSSRITRNKNAAEGENENEDGEMGDNAEGNTPTTTSRSNHSSSNGTPFDVMVIDDEDTTDDSALGNISDGDGNGEAPLDDDGTTVPEGEEVVEVIV